NVSRIGSQGVAINIGGYNSTYDRIVNDLWIQNDTVLQSGTYGNFLKTFGHANNVHLRNNIYSAASLIVGAYASGDIYNVDSNWTSFVDSSNNCWANATYSRGITGDFAIQPIG